MPRLILITQYLYNYHPNMVMQEKGYAGDFFAICMAHSGQQTVGNRNTLPPLRKWVSRRALPALAYFGTKREGLYAAFMGTTLQPLGLAPSLTGLRVSSNDDMSFLKADDLGQGKGTLRKDVCSTASCV